MTGSDILAGVRATCELIAVRHGLELVEVVLTSERRSRILSITLDRPDGLISIEELSVVSEEISRALDLEDPIPGRYTLEVSSAGIERPLIKPGHYRRFQGRTVMVKCHEPVEGRRNFQGDLASAGDDSFVMALEDGTAVEIPYSNVSRTKLVADWEAELRGAGARQDVMGESS